MYLRTPLVFYQRLTSKTLCLVCSISLQSTPKVVTPGLIKDVKYPGPFSVKSLINVYTWDSSSLKEFTGPSFDSKDSSSVRRRRSLADRFSDTLSSFPVVVHIELVGRFSKRGVDKD